MPVAVLAVLAVVLVSFFVANREPVTISFDPTSMENPALSLTGPLWAGLSGDVLYIATQPPADHDVFLYLAETLAAQGFVAVSIGANAM